MNRKVIKYFFELAFIFVVPLLIICLNCNYSNTIEYDNNGNYQATEKHIEFTPPFSYENGYKNIINNFNLWNEEWEIGRYQLNCINSKNPIFVNSSTTYCFTCPNNATIYEFNEQNINIVSITSSSPYTTFTTNSNTTYLMFYIEQDYGEIYKNNVCLNLSVSWANGNYASYEKPLILITETDVSGQDIINYTVWGRLKNSFIEGLQLQNNFVLDIVISYTILWFTMFLIWHIIYLLFDKLFHLRRD